MNKSTLGLSGYIVASSFRLGGVSSFLLPRGGFGKAGNSLDLQRKTLVGG